MPRPIIYRTFPGTGIHSNKLVLSLPLNESKADPFTVLVFVLLINVFDKFFNVG